jgi:hypothetical protein
MCYQIMTGFHWFCWQKKNCHQGPILSTYYLRSFSCKCLILRNYGHKHWPHGYISCSYILLFTKLFYKFFWQNILMNSAEQIFIEIFGPWRSLFLSIVWHLAAAKLIFLRNWPLGLMSYIADWVHWAVWIFWPFWGATFWALCTDDWYKLNLCKCPHF